MRARDCHTVRGRLDPAGGEVTPLDEDGVRAVAGAAARGRRRGGRDLLPARLRQPGARAARRGDPREALPGLSGLHLDRHPRRIPRIRARQHGGPQRLSRAGDATLSRQPGPSCWPTARRSASAATCRSWSMAASGRLMTDAARAQAGAHGVVGPGRRRRRQRPFRAPRGLRDIITSTWAAPAPILPGHRRPAAGDARGAALDGTPLRMPVHRHQRDRRRRRLDRLDRRGGVLRVGPRQRRAPCPARPAMAAAATEPTVTDANLVLGRLGAGARLGGEWRSIPRRRAPRDRAAHRRPARARPGRGGRAASCASPTPTWRAASASSRSSAATIRAALTLVPFGGAGPMHGSPLARALGIPRLLVPPTPGIFCALGMLVADLRHDLVQTRLAPHADLSAAGPQAGVRADAGRGAAPLDARTACRRNASASRCGSTCAISANPMNCRSPLAGFTRARLAGAGARFPRRACPPLRPQRPGGAGRDRQLRRHRHRADRYPRIAASRRGAERAARIGPARLAARLFRSRPRLAATGRRARSGSARRCSRGTRSSDRP